MKLQFDPLVVETAQRLSGISAFIELVYRATPDVELQERDALERLAESEDWDFGDFSVESQLLDVQFKYWLPRLASYSIVILLSSIVETQLYAFARRVGKHAGSAFDPNDLKGSVLDRTAVYVKRVSGSELGKNSRWQKLRDLQNLRDIIVHRAGKPGHTGKAAQQMCELYPGISIDENP